MGRGEGERLCSSVRKIGGVTAMGTEGLSGFCSLATGIEEREWQVYSIQPSTWNMGTKARNLLGDLQFLQPEGRLVENHAGGYL